MMNTPLNCPTGSEIGCSGQLTSGVGMNASVGYGNYNALFVTLKTSDWNGVTMQSNFTWSKALGTGAEVQATSEATPPDPFNLKLDMATSRSTAAWSTTCTLCISRAGTSRRRASMGHLLGGWTIAPMFTAGSGSADHPGHHQRWRPGVW